MLEDINRFLEEEHLGLRNTPVGRFLKRHLTSKRLLAILFITIFTLSVLLFAKYEFIENTERYDKIIAEGKNPYFEAFYWLITTITTVGYGDYTPLSTKGKVLALSVMILGVTLLAFILTQITQRIVSANLGNIFGVNRMKKKVDYILCGWNSVSEAALNEIDSDRHEVVVIDPASRPDLAKLTTIQYIRGDPKSEDVLMKANIKNASNVVLAMDRDSDVLLAIHVIRELNPFIHLVAKINSHEHVALAEAAGADRVVSPPSIGGRLLSIAAEEPDVVDWVTTVTTGKEGLKLVEYDVTKDSPAKGRTIAQLRHTLAGTANVIGIETAAGFEKLPLDSYRLDVGNKLILLVDTSRFKP